MFGGELTSIVVSSNIKLAQKQRDRFVQVDVASVRQRREREYHQPAERSTNSSIPGRNAQAPSPLRSIV